MIENPPDELMDDLCDPDTRSALDDWERSRYGSSDVARRWRALSFIFDADDADADADDAIRRCATMPTGTASRSSPCIVDSWIEHIPQPVDWKP